jgi:hypothetical protein
VSSEIKRLLEQIEAEQLAALRGMSGLASVARHDFIQTKQVCIDECHSRLLELAGETATQVVAEVIDGVTFRYEYEQRQQEILRQQQRSDEGQRVHQALHKQSHAAWRIGDTLIYKLRPSERPVEPDRLWHGTICHILVDCYNKSTYFVESKEYPGCYEMVYAFQIVGCNPATDTQSM